MMIRSPLVRRTLCRASLNNLSSISNKKCYRSSAAGRSSVGSFSDDRNPCRTQSDTDHQSKSNFDHDLFEWKSAHVSIEAATTPPTSWYTEGMPNYSSNFSCHFCHFFHPPQFFLSPLILLLLSNLLSPITLPP